MSQPDSLGRVAPINVAGVMARSVTGETPTRLEATLHMAALAARWRVCSETYENPDVQAELSDEAGERLHAIVISDVARYVEAVDRWFGGDAGLTMLRAVDAEGGDVGGRVGGVPAAHRPLGGTRHAAPPARRHGLLAGRLTPGHPGGGCWTRHPLPGGPVR